MSIVRNVAIGFVATGLLTINTAQADTRFGIGVSQWGLADSFDITTYMVNLEFAEIERLWNIRIVSGAFYNFDNDAGYISVGWLKDWRSQSGKWSWGIAGNAGYFSGDVLGNEVEFYTRGMLNYHLSEKGFIRAEIGHISNAGFGDTNPGSENLALSYNWVF